MKNLVKSNIIVADFDDEKFTDIYSAVKVGAVALSLVTTNHAFGTIPLFQRFSPDDIQILDTGLLDRKKMPMIQNYLDDLIEKGLQDNGKTFVPCMAGSSNQRQGQGVLADQTKVWSMIDWCSCGAVRPQKMTKLTCQKIAKYLALMMSTCHQWQDSFSDDPDMPYPEIEDFIVLNDVEVPAIGIVDKVTPKSVEEALLLALDNENMKITDGHSMYVVDDASWSKKQCDRFDREHDTFTFRAALMKGCMVTIRKSVIIHFLEMHGLEPMRKDAWGETVNILDAKVITFKSVFKGWKCFKSFQDYCKEFHARNHEVWTCVQAHGHKWASLPYQQLQTLDCTDEEIVELAKLSYEWMLDSAKPGSFGKLIGGALGKILDEYPALLHDAFVQDALQHAWISKCKQVYGGRILRVSHNLMCSPDPIAVLEGVFGLPVVGVIPKGHVITSGFKAGKKLGCTRCPHLDHAWFIARNMSIPEEWSGAFIGTTIFYSCHDLVMLLHQMDFDGDKSNVTDNPLLISIAERSQAKYGNVPLLYAAMDAGDAKSTCDDYEQELKDLFRNLHNAPIGTYAICLNKLWSMAKACFQKFRLKIACVTRKANTCIDEAGHGVDASVGVAEATVAECNDIKKPTFMKYSKGTISKDGRDIVPALGRYQFLENHTVERYSRVMQLMLPKLISDVVSFKDVFQQVGKFDHRILMSNADIKKRLPALAGLISDDGGLFNKLCRATVEEEAMITSSSSMAAEVQFTDDAIANMQLEIADFAMDRGLTLNDAIDVIVFTLFYKMKRTDRFVPQLKRWFFLAFGDRVLENVIKNLSANQIEAAEYEEEMEGEEESET